MKMKSLGRINFAIHIASTALLSFLIGTLISCHKNSEHSHSVLANKLKANTWTKEEHVEGLPAKPFKGTRIEVLDETHGNFFTESRTDKLVQKNCLECHRSGKIEAMGSKAPDSHWDIHKTFKHASKNTMTCTTCHQSAEVTSLRSFNGNNLSMNEPFKLCAQCHFAQEKDWRLGAHGKRLHSWSGDRVVTSCTSCHNPHKPAFEKRWPKTFNKNLNHFSEQKL